MNDSKLWLLPGQLDSHADRTAGLDWLAAQWAGPKARMVAVAPDSGIEWSAGLPLLSRVDQPYDPDSCFYLGRLPDGPVFARMLPQAQGEVRELLDDIPSGDIQIVFAAAALVNWHSQAGFCPVCGNATKVEPPGWSRSCPVCPRELFPRTDPAVIVAIRDRDNRLLLGRQPVWPPRRMSVFAGFVEAGESLEQAVHREVAEEVGIKLESVCYFGSQPWPFPRSLMLGFTARARTTQQQIDGEEIEYARWFSKAEFTQAVAAGELLLPNAHSIARRMINGWLGDTLPL
ncbi:MAG: NAD(+) diphosphatase [Propionibacteriaceae bacterium]|jgi:NAD+ diphosphatase|nr:NAD(+) diphosphatase [Propionibacteriaceae bacterium]